VNKLNWIEGNEKLDYFDKLWVISLI
jgi:hypothetical protein